MKKIEQYFKELLEQYPYKQAGNRDSYSEYNEGWQDALDLVMQVTKQMQLDVIKETIKLCAEKASIETTKAVGVSEMYLIGLNRDSILNCAEILKKEL